MQIVVVLSLESFACLDTRILASHRQLDSSHGFSLLPPSVRQLAWRWRDAAWGVEVEGSALLLEIHCRLLSTRTVDSTASTNLLGLMARGVVG